MDKFSSFLFVCCLFLLGKGWAQTLFEPEALTIEDGLSQGFVSAILQDEEGFLWFSTKNGLNRYDGRQFEAYTNNPDDPYSISNDWVTCILEKGDFLLVGTHSSFLNLFHKKTKRFHRIPLAVNGIEAFGDIESIHVDTLGQYWISTHNKYQLLRIVFPDGFWSNLPQDTTVLQKVEITSVLQCGYQVELTNDPNRILIIDCEGSLKELDIQTLEIESISATSPYNQFRIFKKIKPTLGLCATDLLPQSPLKLCRLRAGVWEVIPSNFYLKDISYFDPTSNQLWVQRFEDYQLLAFNLDSILNADQLEEQQAEYIVNNINTNILEIKSDRSKILWIGTGGFGIRKISSRKLAIKNYLAGSSIDNNFFTYRDGGLLFPMNRVIPHSGQLLEAKLIDRFLSQSDIFELFWLDKGAQQWLVTINTDRPYKYSLGLYQYQDGNIIEKVRIPLPSIWSDSDLSMVLSKDEKLYISFSNYFLSYDPLTDQKQLYTIDLFKSNAPTIFYMDQTANGDFWIGSSQGLIRVQAKHDGFDFKLIKVLRNDICASVLTDPSDANILWIGTKGGGLHRLDTRTMEFSYLDSRSGLPNDVIYAVQPDESGALWLSSNKGIIAYDPKTGSIRNFTSEDGMQSDEFNTFAFGKSPDGTLLFGGINGISAFHPEDLEENPHLPAVRITSLAVNNQSVSTLDCTNILTKAIEFTEGISLDYTNNSLALTFAALEFTTPGKNTYKYYLEGAEEEWANTSTDNRAAYLNLSPGKYAFKVKAANGDGLWSDQITTLAITILPPWYRTTLAYLLYALLIGMAIWFLWQMQTNRVKLKYELASEQQEADRLKEQEAFRSRLYTNITHEFRTPLTVILGTSEQLKDRKPDQHPEKRQLSLIHRNGENLLNLVNQILDLSKIEHNKLQVHHQQGDILRYLRYITESFYSVANDNNVLLKLSSNTTEIWMDYDAEKIRQIVTNLLSNAIKYTTSGGKVLITVEENADQLRLVVQDTGRGMAAQHLPHIFERYYQAEDDIAKTGGTGIGLALTRELVHLLDGAIQVESELGKGSSFTVSLPIRREAPLQETVPQINARADIPPNQKASKLKDLPSLLIVEDNLDVVEYLNSCLAPHYDLSYAYNGQAGIEKALELTPDLIVSDVMMPEKTGFELTDALKKDERTSHIPIVLLTAKADIENRLIGLQRGADVYLPKPFHQQELLVNLENLLTTRRTLQAKYQQRALATDQDLETNAIGDQEQVFLDKIRQYLDAELDDPDLKAADVARAIGMSRSNLYAKLTAVTGLSFNVYLRTLRLQKAKDLLQTSSLSVSEIAYAVGFSRLSYFSDQFAKQYGHPPSELRS